MSEAIYDAPANYDALISALTRRTAERGLSYTELDLLTGAASGMTGKAFGPSQTKKLGWKTTWDYIEALGLRMVLLEDPAAAQRYAARAGRRSAHQARSGNFAQTVNDRVITRVLRHLATTFTRRQILEIIARTRGAIADEQAAKAAQAPESKRTPRPTSPAAAAYDGGMLSVMSDFEGLADATRLHVSSREGEQRGGKRGLMARPLFSPDPKTMLRRTQRAYLARREKSDRAATSQN